MPAGRTPKPNKLKLIEGNPGQRPLKPQVETLPASTECPDHLEGFARYFWERTVPLLEQMFLLSASDWAVLEETAMLYERWRVAVEAGDDRLMLRWSPQLLSHLKALGMTPADRLRMVVPVREEPKKSHVLD